MASGIINNPLAHRTPTLLFSSSSPNWHTVVAGADIALSFPMTNFSLIKLTFLVKGTQSSNRAVVLIQPDELVDAPSYVIANGSYMGPIRIGLGAEQGHTNANYLRIIAFPDPGTDQYLYLQKVQGIK